MNWLLGLIVAVAIVIIVLLLMPPVLKDHKGLLRVHIATTQPLDITVGTNPTISVAPEPGAKYFSGELTFDAKTGQNFNLCTSITNDFKAQAMAIRIKWGDHVYKTGKDLFPTFIPVDLPPYQITSEDGKPINDAASFVKDPADLMNCATWFIPQIEVSYMKHILGL